MGRFIIAFFLFTWFGMQAQNKQILYDFNEIPQSLLLNPGTETDFKWYAGVPLISGISGYGGSNGVAINDIFANDGIDINTKIRERVLGSMNPRDEFSATVQLEYLSGGFRSGYSNLFYTFGGYLEIDNITYWPQDFADLIFDGNVDQLNRKYDFSDLNTSGSMINVLHFGINKKVSRKLTIGARGKIYSGIVDYRSTGNRGFLINRQGENNLISTAIDADMSLKTSGTEAFNDGADDDNLPGVIIGRALFGGDLGLGVDAGFTYHLTEQTTITGSIVDLGFLYHGGNTQNYTLEGRAQVEGIEIDVLRQFSNLNRDFWQDLVDEVEAAVPFETNTNGYFSLRPTKLYGSIRHDFGKPIGNSSKQIACDCTAGSSGANGLRSRYRNSYGAQVFVINRPKGPQAAVTGFYTRRFGNAMAVKATYTADKFSLTNIGLGLNLQAGPLNIYAMADNLLSYQNIAASNYASFQLGLNIISWGKK